MGEGNAQTYGTLALLLAQYLQKKPSAGASAMTPDMFQPPGASPNMGGSILQDSGLSGGVSPAMVELLKQMQQRNNFGQSLNDEVNADVYRQMGVPSPGRSLY